MKTVTIRDEAHWHELRAQHVGGSEVPALFGEHPQLTRYELFQRKDGKVSEPDLSDNERVFWGQTLEPAIAIGVAKLKSWNIRNVRRYHSMPDIGLGGSLDFEIIGHERGPGVLEIKTADRLVARGWQDGPPLNYELQVQSYLACTGRTWGVMAVLVGGNELRLFEYERRPRTIAIIEKAVAEFWQSIRENKPPPPDYSADGETIARLYASTMEGKTVDLSASNRLTELIADYRRGAALEKEGASIKSAAKAEILPLIEDAERVICGPATISTKMIPGAHIEFERKPHRDFRIHVKE